VTIGVVGLGISGLRAAMLLERAGFETKLFEARGRVGGRLYTSDEGEGVLYEAGGEWIDADHCRVIALLEEFGIEPDPRGAWPKRLQFKGKHTTEDLIWNDALEDDLRVENAARNMCAGLKIPPWENAQAGEWDRRTVTDFVCEHTESERGLWYVNAKFRSDEGEDLDRVGLLGWLVGFQNYLSREGDELSAFRFPGGASRLCEKMLGSLKPEAQFSRVLERVRQDASGVTLVFNDGAERVDRVILTLPPPALEQVVFEPALSVGKRCAVEACRLSRAIKITWQFDRPWWTERGWAGNMLCDTALQQTWDASLGEAPVMSAYVCGDEAERWTQRGDPVNEGLFELGQLFPDSMKHFVRGWVHDWVRDPYAQGAFSHLPPGYVLEHMRHMNPPESRVHFAGEHTASWTGFIEGAVQSAERVVAEVMEVESAEPTSEA
jgi:monoamine oxidase